MRPRSFDTTRSLPDLAAGLLMAGVCVGCGGGGGDSSSVSATSPATPVVVGPPPCSNNTLPAGSLATDSVTIDVSSNEGAAASLIGFVHGIVTPFGPDYDFPPETATRIAALKPTFWKVSDERHYLKFKVFGPAINFSGSELFCNYAEICYPWNNDGTATGTFDNWQSFDAHELSLLQRSLTQGMPVDYWSILQEPRTDAYTATDQQRLLQTYVHGYHDFKDGHPEQKVIGPTTISYISTQMQRLLDFAVANNLLFDAIDWHEFGRPEDVVGHVQDLNTLLAARPSLGRPPVIIDEYASPEQHHLPGFAVGWFYYLEKAGVLFASRACFNIVDPVNGVWDDCWDGLDGLFMKDNLTPQALYWVFNSYAQMTGRKLTSTSSAPNDVVGLARSTSAGETKVLLGRFVSDINQPAGVPKDITVRLQGIPAGTDFLTVSIDRIPYCGPDRGVVLAQPLGAPESLGPLRIAVVNGTATVVLNTFRDRDAYYLSFK